ncbi:MAG: large conductance mechanosensitive channel protein MscL [Clostridiales bacterium]|nr:large conductance mechanosensitive channel protein MscL [Clostridiales bacterium]
MKKFFGEFKKFITRGNVLDMAVGVIVGGAFTGIVNGLSNFILKPIINWILALILGEKGLSGAITFLSKAEKDGVVDLANSIYIDWGAFISAIINFFIIAFVLFAIVKTMNKIKEGNEKLNAEIKKDKLTKEQKKELKLAGVNRKDKQAVKEYFDRQAQVKAEAEAEAKRIADEKALADRLANPTTEDLLKQIKELLEKKV